MKPILIAVAIIACAAQADAACSGCSCGPVCHAASAVREHKPVRRAAARVARVALFPLRALRGCCQ